MERNRIFAGLYLLLVVPLSLLSFVVEGNIEDRYIGCYYDAYNQSALQRSSIPNDSPLTTQLCIEQCRLLGATYAGLQNSEACLCGNNFGFNLPDSYCNSLCPGDQSQYCGGWNGRIASYSLYTVCDFGYYGNMCDQVCHCRRQAPCDLMTGRCPNECEEKWFGMSCNITYLMQKYIGCFRDDVPDRAISPQLFYDNYMTVDWCTDKCISMNNSIAGLEVGGYCSCGEMFDKYGQLNENNCNVPCGGNASEICGGSYANSVYSVCPPGYYGPKCVNRCHCFNNSRCVYLTGVCNSTCKAGWTGTNCNIRDCSTGGGDCSQNKTCSEIDLMSTKVIRCRCLPGYGTNFSQGTCADVNECELGICDESTTNCTNTVGSYECVCKSGYRQQSETSCSDIDECSQLACNVANSYCTNTRGSYECICKSGYESHDNDNKKCYDKDECSQINSCDNATSICMNTIGSFMCSCLDGYQKHNDTFCKRESHSKSGEIAGAVIGSVCGVALIAVIIFFGLRFYRRRRQQHGNSKDSSENRHRTQLDEKLENPAPSLDYEALSKRQRESDQNLTYTELTGPKIASQSQNIGIDTGTDDKASPNNLVKETNTDYYEEIH